MGRRHHFPELLLGWNLLQVKVHSQPADATADAAPAPSTPAEQLAEDKAAAEEVLERKPAASPAAPTLELRLEPPEVASSASCLHNVPRWTSLLG